MGVKAFFYVWTRIGKLNSVKNRIRVRTKSLRMKHTHQIICAAKWTQQFISDVQATTGIQRLLAEQSGLLNQVENTVLYGLPFNQTLILCKGFRVLRAVKHHQLEHHNRNLIQDSSMMSQTTATWDLDSDRFQRFNNIGFCVQFAIVIIGCVTTPMIPVFLLKVNIGSKSNQQNDWCIMLVSSLSVRDFFLTSIL